MAYRILIVCTGNTCRSPMATAILNHLLRERKDLEVEVLSAGTAASLGGQASMRARQALVRMAIAPCEHRSRSLSGDMLEEADLILVMEQRHLRYAREIAPLAAGKIRLLGEYDRQSDDMEDIADPIGGTLDDYIRSAERIHRCLLGLVAQLPRLIQGAKQ